jgi:hypothetical protein
VQNIYENNNPIKETCKELEDEVANSTTTTATTASDNSALYPPPIRSQSTAAAAARNTNSYHHTARKPFSILSILYWPLGIAWTITWSILSFACKSIYAKPYLLVY